MSKAKRKTLKMRGWCCWHRGCAKFFVFKEHEAAYWINKGATVVPVSVIEDWGK